MTKYDYDSKKVVKQLKSLFALHFAIALEEYNSPTACANCKMGTAKHGKYSKPANQFITFFWCALFGYLYFSFFSIVECTRIGHFNRPGMALTPFPSCVG